MDTIQQMVAGVVYHLVPTSNHNYLFLSIYFPFVVYHLVPTSNHNGCRHLPPARRLFIILFLHQTTTADVNPFKQDSLFIILFLHQTTTLLPQFLDDLRCLSSCSYIKPQLSSMVSAFRLCCLSSCSYIKPQHGHYSADGCRSCLSSCSYIKPQLFISFYLFSFCCLSSCSYIKPQRLSPSATSSQVVYHLVPTSNHNGNAKRNLKAQVVYHLVPTSNHNHQSHQPNGG